MYEEEERQSRGPVDTTAFRWRHGVVIALLGVGFVISEHRAGFYVVLVVAIVLAIGALTPRLDPFRAVYNRLLVPANLLHPRFRREDPAPHQFAQGVAAVLLFLACAVYWLYDSVASAWALVWLVILMSLVDAVFRVCLGCAIYNHLGWLRRFFESPG